MDCAMFARDGLLPANGIASATVRGCEAAGDAVRARAGLHRNTTPRAQLVILCMRTDPHPGDGPCLHAANRSVMISYAHCVTILAAPQAMEMKGRAGWVPQPQFVVLDGKRPNRGGKDAEKIPESPGGAGFHLTGGHSRSSPSSASL